MKFIEIKASAAMAGMTVYFGGVHHEITAVSRCVLSKGDVFITLSKIGTGVWGENDKVILVIDMEALHTEALVMDKEMIPLNCQKWWLAQPDIWKARCLDRLIDMAMIEDAHVEALLMNAAIDFNTEQNREMADRKAMCDAFVATLCRGFIKQYLIASKGMEVLWAILPNGEIYRTGELKQPNLDFDKAGREWTLCDITEERLLKTDGVSFCGNYPVPKQCLSTDE